MKLAAIYFNAFKSLLEKELVITHDCIGIVGTNESGKSNILAAINILGGSRKLTIADTPKMRKTATPYISYKFLLNSTEKQGYQEVIAEWEKVNSTLPGGFTYDPDHIYYHVKFNSRENVENREFDFAELNLKDGHHVLLKASAHHPVNIPINSSPVSINKAVIVNDQVFTDYANISDLYRDLEITKESIQAEEVLVNDFAQESSESPERVTASDKAENGRRKKNLERLYETRNGIEVAMKDYDIAAQVKGYQTGIALMENELNEKRSEAAILRARIAELQAIAAPDEAQALELTTAQQEISGKETLITELEGKINELNNLVEFVQQPIEEKYTTDAGELKVHLDPLIQNYFKDLIPRVVFWEYSDKYILQSETLFSDILAKESLSDISRPLVNVFRIGMGINTIDELKTKINELQGFGNERSRLEQALNKRINEFIMSVWKEYDQSMKLTLEKDQVRIEIFDPKHDEASYYNMEERSQGCQTFLSFLMTIGAEAEHGVITNTILLLDEPETHLHPSGVRFMLQELIKIAQKGNQVIYATHSIFLIDRLNFDRHIILEKIKEQTFIKPANIGRVGYFMQEEVLYNTLDLNLGKDLTSTNRYNFVFEGDGDAVLFQHFYDKILTKEQRPFPLNNSSFYQGGKCTDIQKYINQRPIQLGSVWVFILDKDKPADELKKVIEGKYRKYIGTDIFVFQYENATKKSKEKVIEFEDLLLPAFIQQTYHTTAARMQCPIDEKEIQKQVTEEEPYDKYNEALLKQFVSKDIKDDFKATFKQELNAGIKASLENNTKEETFKASFPEYFAWATGIMHQVIEKIKPKAE